MTKGYRVTYFQSNSAIWRVLRMSKCNSILEVSVQPFAQLPGTKYYVSEFSSFNKPEAADS